MKFIIIASGYNCQFLARRCYDSLTKLANQNFVAHLISDGSTDGTLLGLKPQPNIRISRYSDNLGATYRRHEAIKKASPDEEDVIIFLGLDDALFAGALDRIQREYDKGKWMTYGNWKDQHGNGLPEDFDLEFDEETHITRNYRQVKYRSTAPNTFKYFLYKNIPEDELKMDDGRWFDVTTESHVMLSCLEMCGKFRIGVISDRIYQYNRTKNRVRNRVGREYADSVYQQVMKRPKKDKLIRP